jgi:hypothetical protein
MGEPRLPQIAFIEEPGHAIIDKRGVAITYQSGSETFVQRMSVEDYRAFIAAGVGLLHEYDAAQRSRVVPFKRGEHAH